MEIAVTEFIREFIQKENETHIYCMSERNDVVFHLKRDELKMFYSEDLNPEMVDRPRDLNEKWFEENTRYLNLIQPRQLFQIKKYQHPILECIYRCYMSTVDIGDTNYFCCFFIREVSGIFTFVSQYNFDFSNRQENEGFLDNGLYWNWRGGIKLKELGVLVEVCKFKEPKSKEHLCEYKEE